MSRFYFYLISFSLILAVNIFSQTDTITILHVNDTHSCLESLGPRNPALGPEFRRPWRGTAGPWTGTYHTSMEGALRVPFILRWPGRVAPGGATNEIVHITDLYATLARVVGAEGPQDRPIDGVDQLDFFVGKKAQSNRERFVYYIKQELRAAKWRDWKMHMVMEREPNEGPNHLETPFVFNLTRDPKEETDVGNEASWVRTPLRRMIHDFQQSLKANPPLPPGAPDDYRPGR